MSTITNASTRFELLNWVTSVHRLHGFQVVRYVDGEENASAIRTRHVSYFGGRSKNSPVTRVKQLHTD